MKYVGGSEGNTEDIIIIILPLFSSHLYGRVQLLPGGVQVLPGHLHLRPQSRVLLLRLLPKLKRTIFVNISYKRRASYIYYITKGWLIPKYV